MKIDETTRFPHPVLSMVTGDYPDSEFSLDISVAERTKTGKLEIEFQEKITESKIADLVTTGKAAIGMFVICLETYYNKLVPLDLKERKIVFDAGVLKGRVILRPVIWANDNVTGFESDSLHEDFADINWRFSRGSILALGLEQIIHAGQDKLAPMETIFALVQSEELKDGEFRIGLDSDKIKIFASPNTYNRAHLLRTTRDGKVQLLNGLYLPVVMEVLLNLKDSGGSYENRRWFRIFTAKCESLGIKPEAVELFQDAQRLLKYPFNRINFEEGNH